MKIQPELCALGRTFLAGLCFFSLGFCPTPVLAEDIDNTSHLPLPRFASLRGDAANLRAGPGFRYPIEWVYKKRGLPVEITAEYDVWRRVRDPGGTEGWIRKTELTGRRGLIVTGNNGVLRAKADDTSPIRAYLEQGAVGQLIACEKAWCKARFGDVKGYLPKSRFWGAYTEEEFN